MSCGPKVEEVSPETQEVLRFLIRENAFDVEFLVTAIQEYWEHNKPQQRKEP